MRLSALFEDDHQSFSILCADEPRGHITTLGCAVLWSWRRRDPASGDRVSAYLHRTALWAGHTKLSLTALLGFVAGLAIMYAQPLCSSDSEFCLSRRLHKRSHARLEGLLFWGSLAGALPALCNVLAS